MTHDRLRAAIGEAVGTAVVDLRPLSGGDVARSYRVTLQDGRTVFAKTHATPPPGFFLTEAAGLSWLREAASLPVPEVLAVSDGSGPDDDGPTALLVLEWIDESRNAGADEEAFGRALARLHRTGAPCFGREDRRPTGSRSLPNDPAGTWPEFYADRRLRPLIRMARDGHAVDDRVLVDIERIAGELSSFGAADEPPARLHGDLWAGNRIVDRSGVSWLIDPAAHGGHREFDLAMMRVFGGFGGEVFAAYNDEFPLAEGWQRRVPLHQLAPLLVHAIKFGGSYRSAVAEAVRALRAA
ncbi:MAG: putative ribulosamine/erythrulosamine 3-kinase [Ilumatobacteraceae bacterium]|nr:putative ribulosamine/erythrulosamine 3-kinase [Ilumatobacteraceae bacterium]